MKKAIGYSTLITVSMYAISELLVKCSVLSTLSGRLAGISTALLASYLVSRAFHIKLPGLKSSGDGIPHALALMFPLYAISIIGILYLGPAKFMDAAKPGFVEEWSPILVPYSLAFWALSGLIMVYFYDVAPYELFSGRGRLAGVVGATIVFSLNYNQPLITGFWSVEDIIFFGAALTYSYSVHREPSALLIVYLLSEVPLWWCLLAPLGVSAFEAYIVARFLVSAFFLTGMFLKLR